MENPSTWTPLHNCLADIISEVKDPAAQITALTQALHNFNATEVEVASLIKEHADGVKAQVCGLSLPAFLISRIDDHL